jgi:hypothetical protein
MLLQPLPYDRRRLLQGQVVCRGQEAAQPIHGTEDSLVGLAHLSGDPFGPVCVQPALQPVQQHTEAGPARVNAH